MVGVGRRGDKEGGAEQRAGILAGTATSMPEPSTLVTVAPRNTRRAPSLPPHPPQSLSLLALFTPPPASRARRNRDTSPHATPSAPPPSSASPAERPGGDGGEFRGALDAAVAQLERGRGAEGPDAFLALGQQLARPHRDPAPTPDASRRVFQTIKIACEVAAEKRVLDSTVKYLPRRTSMHTPQWHPSVKSTLSLTPRCCSVKPTIDTVVS